MPKKRHTMNDNMIAKGHIDVVDLAKRVCDILGVQVHYSSNSNQLWLSRCGTDDEVPCVFGHMSDMPDMPEMLPASFNATRVDDDIVSSYSFIDRLRANQEVPLWNGHQDIQFSESHRQSILHVEDSRRDCYEM